MWMHDIRPSPQLFFWPHIQFIFGRYRYPFWPSWKWKTIWNGRQRRHRWLSAKFIDFLFHPEVNINRHISRSTSIIYLSVHNQLRYKLRTAELRWQLRQRWRRRQKKWLTLNERCTWYRMRKEMEKETKLLMRRSVKVAVCWIHEFARKEKW